MSSVEHKVDMFRLAQERRRQGKPQWEYTVRGVKDALEAFDEHGDFIRSRDEVVAAIKRSSWYRQSDEFGELWDVVDEMSDAGRPDIDWEAGYDEQRHFNHCLERIYDLADWDRAWLA